MINEDFSKRGKLQDVGRWYINRFVENVAQSLPANASILDAGAGECVYKSFFSHCNYMAIDLAVGESRWNYANLDYIAPLHEMPIDDGTFDALLCTQVLEHLELPRESIKEMYRVLKPGGKMMCLEFSIPTSFWFKFLYDFYSFQLMPLAGKILAGNSEAYLYLPESIRKFPAPDDFAAMMRDTGFSRVTFRRLTNGIAVIYIGVKP